MEEKIFEQAAEQVVKEAAGNDAAVKAVEKAGEGVAKMALKVNKLEGAIGIALIAALAIGIEKGCEIGYKKIKEHRAAKKAEKDGVTVAENGAEVVTNAEKAQAAED